MFTPPSACEYTYMHCCSCAAFILLFLSSGPVLYLEKRVQYEDGHHTGCLKVHADQAQGRFCARRPGLVLAVAAAAAALCALGLIRLRVETDPQRLWVGAGSQAAREKADYEVPFSAGQGLCLCCHIHSG